MRSGIAILAVLIGPFGALPAGAAEPCTAGIGQWNWFIGGQVTLSDGGQAHWKPATPSIPPASGTWTCDPKTGKYAVTWQNGFVDTLSLSSDGTKFTGRSSTGAEVSGWRSGAPASGNASATGTGTTASDADPAAPTPSNPTATPAKPPTSGAIDHNPSVRELLQDRPRPDPRGWKQDRSGGPQKGPKPFEGWQ